MTDEKESRFYELLRGSILIGGVGSAVRRPAPPMGGFDAAGSLLM